MINHIIGSAVLALFFTSSLYASPIKVGIIDTGFCLSDKPKNRKIHRPFLAAGKIHIEPCTLGKEHPRLHGQLVLEHFLSVLGNEKDIEIFPIVVFDDKGRQKLDFWKKALEYSKGFDVLLIASGFPYYKRISGLPELETLSFAASGTRESGIKKNTSLFPQVLAPHRNLFLIGAYSKSIGSNDAMVDSRRMYPKYIDYFFPDSSGTEKLTGSSRAVATALGIALRDCKLANLKQCIAKKRKYIKVINQKEPIRTY
tara:strand:+ start:74926 stop:75693 length:768 start_codon:yes stop_codon:yes gene_type:complete